MELLQLVDQRLRPLAVADESALQAVLEEVAASPRPAGVSPDVESRTVLAGRPSSIEAECRMLREHLDVESTFVSRVDVDALAFSSDRPRQASADPSESDQADDNDARFALAVEAGIAMSPNRWVASLWNEVNKVEGVTRYSTASQI